MSSNLTRSIWQVERSKLSQNCRLWVQVLLSSLRTEIAQVVERLSKGFISNHISAIKGRSSNGKTLLLQGRNRGSIPRRSIRRKGFSFTGMWRLICDCRLLGVYQRILGIPLVSDIGLTLHVVLFLLYWG